MKTNERAILEAWHLIETLAPHRVAGLNEEWKAYRFKNRGATIKTSEIFMSDQLHEEPWKSIEVKTGTFQHVYYLECFEQYRLVEALRKIFDVNDEVINKSEQKIASFSFLIDQNGKYVKNSIFAPPLMYMLRQLDTSRNIDYSKFDENYKRSQDSLEMKAQEFLANGVDSKSLDSLVKEYERHFFRMSGKRRTFRELQLLFESTQNNSLPLQSFYTNDLQRILAKGLNQTLEAYLMNVTPENRLHIDENRDYIEMILQPKFLPNGRWPSPVEHRLSLMQQVAVNQFFNENNVISSVNGPPGTGKTTLLKDVFAEIVVQRAETISSLAHPSEMFIGKFEPLRLKDSPYPYNVSKLNPLLSRFSMVVASSNNAAVENISKDLPKEKEIIRRNSNSTYDRLYAEEASSFNLFTSVSENLIGNDEKAWGLFSASLGKTSNINKFSEQLFNPSKEDSFINELERLARTTTVDDWKSAVKEFNEVFAQVNEMKQSLQVLYEANTHIEKIYKELSIIDQTKPDLSIQLETLQEWNDGLWKRKEITEQQLNLLPKPTWWQRIFNKQEDDRAIHLKKELNELLEQWKENEQKATRIKEDITALNRKQHQYEVEVQEYGASVRKYESENLYIPDRTYWNDDEKSYAFRQIHTPWLTDALNCQRGLLFLKAMKLQNVTLALNNSKVRTATRLLRYRQSLDLSIQTHREILEEMWKTLHMITPLISTTFASFSTMYKGIDQDFIDYLFIDEAGQASPQQAAGALWRSKRALVVGDPLQIEPVVTTDSTLLHDIRSYFNISSEYVDMNASVQALADQSNPKGMLTEQNQWMGIPLWVHRRCDEPMFSISNEIAYENKMVLANKRGKDKALNAYWFDCKGTATNRHYIEAQGKMLADLIMSRKTEEGLPDIYVITPFSAVKKGIITTLSQTRNAFPIEWLNERVGTVHTFQGKEADIVYFVVGTDANSEGAANWSCSKPNLINVAATRAKKEFHVIGDYQRLADKPYYSTIAKYAKVKNDVKPNIKA